MGPVWLGARPRCPPPSPVPVCGVGVRARVWVSAAPRLSFGGCWGVCVLVRPCRVVSCTSWLGLLCGGACLCARPACSPPFLAGVLCVGVCAGPASQLCPDLLGWVVGVCILCFCFLFGVSWLGFVVLVAGCPCPGPCGPCPPIPFLSGWAACSFFFPAWCVSAWLDAPFPGGALFLAWCCRFWLSGPPVPLWGSCLRCPLGGLFSRPLPLSHLFFFGGGLFLGGGLPVPPSAFPGRAHPLARIQCGLPGCCWRCILLGRVPAPWAGWAMYTLSSAPLPAGLGPGSAGWAAAPGGCVWLWVRGLGLSVFLLLCGAGFNLLSGPPPLLPGARWPRVWPAVPMCGVLVRRLPGCAVACFG